jgi:hypothetical protein
MNISFAKYVANILDGENSSIKVVIENKEWSVPLDPANRHYAAIMEQVGSGTLAIAEADNGE